MRFTQNPIGSDDQLDLQDNAISFDYAMNSPAALWTDRFGKQHKTIQQALKDVGFKPAGFDFVTGGTLGIGDRDKCVFYPTDGYWYSWNGKLPYVVPTNSSPAPGGKKGWKQTSLDNSLKIEELDMKVNHLSNLDIFNAHKFKIMFELKHQFDGYDAVKVSGGYSFLYATGHSFDHVAKEIWIAYQGNGGDSGQWYVVYDSETLEQKSYFKCGKRWTKTFTLNYINGKRFLYGRGDNGFLTIYDVTAIPNSGGTVVGSLQPKSNIGALFSSVMGKKILAAHRGQTTNVTTQFNTYLALNPETFEHEQVYRLNTVIAGDTDGIDEKLYKTQGVCFIPNGIGISYGGLVYKTDKNLKTIKNDFRLIQGVNLVSSDGHPIASSLFDPYEAMEILSDLGYNVTRFETEGLFYDPENKKISTLWHISDTPDSKILLVECFSANKTALDFGVCSVPLLPLVPETMSLYRSDQNGQYPVEPVTGEKMQDIADIIKMMIKYDQREIMWYSTNFSSLVSNTATIPGSARVKLFRGNNTTFFLTIFSSGTSQEWLVNKQDDNFSYTRIDQFAEVYRFENTGTGDFIGNGSPEGIVKASVGSTYRNRLGGDLTTLYVKKYGTENTGWVGIA